MYLTYLIYNYKYIKEIEEKNLIISKIKNYLLIHDCRKDKEVEPKKSLQHINKTNILLDLLFLF